VDDSSTGCAAPDAVVHGRDQLSRRSRVIVDDGNDLDLVERARAGDRAALTALVVRYQRQVFSAAYWVVRRVDDANDIAQDVFLKVAERLDDFDPRFKFFSWIYRITVNESLNLLRRNSREETVDGELERLPADGHDPERLAGDAQLSAHIRTALMRMPANDRTVIALRHFSECSYEEIGQILELDGKTVKSRLFEARQRLRASLAELGTI
jgi:RNA polymerase sigma-70 factor (ECF subfamily)